MNNINNLNRRKFLSGAGIVAGSAMIAPAWAGAEFKSDYNPAAKETQILTGNEFDLYVRKMPVVINGRNTTATLINDSLPAPTLKMKEGETVTIRVHNEMEETTSIHWHGLIVPYEMDGVPGISFDGIPPKSTFTYTFKLQQSGT